MTLYLEEKRQSDLCSRPIQKYGKSFTFIDLHPLPWIDRIDRIASSSTCDQDTKNHR